VQQAVKALGWVRADADGVAGVVDGVAAQGVDRVERRVQRREIGVRVGDDGDLPGALDGRLLSWALGVTGVPS
jgi:hypothetical protein